MIKKLFCLITAMGISISLLCFGQSAFSVSDTDCAKEIADGIITYSQLQSGAGSVQEWVDTALTDGAGTTSEWYIIGLLQYDKSIDFSGYADALEDYLSKNDIASASSRLKYALVLYGCGRGDNLFVKNTLEDSIGKQGIMSYVYGLHLLSNGLTSESITAEEVIQKILLLQLSDGGWAVTGTRSDADVTAMTLQALAPYYQEKADVKQASDSALQLLSEIQHESGAFSSYGVQNPESTAQVITALSALGTDPFSDSRFIKENNTLLDGIMKFCIDGGGFSRTLGGVYNQNASVQVFYSMVAAYRQENGLGPLYIFDISAEGELPEGEAVQNSQAKSEEQMMQNTGEVQEKNDAHEAVNSEKSDSLTEGFNVGAVSIKIWIYAAIASAFVIVLSVLALKKCLNKGNFLIVALIAAAAILFVFFSKIQTVSEYYSAEDTDIYTEAVTLSISCETIIGQSDAEYVPDDGVILPETEIGINPGDTVYDVIERASKKFGIQLQVESTSSVYISGISYIYEFDFGDLSGWIYLVNNEIPSVSCGEYLLSNGDSIEWRYTVDLGNDFE